MCGKLVVVYIRLYAFPVLSFVMPEQLGISVPQVGSMFLVFVAAMFAVGPFHAYLCDEYKRKNVLLYSTLILLATIPGYILQIII